MKYHSSCFYQFQYPMKKSFGGKKWKRVSQKYPQEKQKNLSKLVEEADDIGNDNPMAYNEMFALVMVYRRKRKALSHIIQG